tara:strand:+ start:770 stop:1150 length:381 start_codon:yes stop_codon:yes gene_type:complete
MPEYSFNCSECDSAFSEVWSMSEYDCKINKVICPKCQSSNVFRDFAEDRVVSNYVKGLHEASTLGEYADKQVKKLGKSKVEQMRRDQKTKKKKTLESKLPSGMSKTSYENTARISKSEMLKRRNGK